MPFEIKKKIEMQITHPRSKSCRRIRQLFCMKANSRRMIVGANTRSLLTQADRAAADTVLRNVSSKYATNGAYQVVVIHALRKEPDEMSRWLDNAHATHDSGLTQLVIIPFVFEYRDDPRFMALCQKLNVQLPSPSVKP